MNVNTGEIRHFEEGEGVPEGTRRSDWIRIPADKVEQLKRASIPRRKAWMRNIPCPCGSGIKFKRCCWAQEGAELPTR